MKYDSKEICQSCGMPFNENRRHGTEADGRRSEEYCSKCMENGIFCSNDSMQDMMERTLPQMMAENLGLTEDKAREVLSRELYPTLKRWQDYF